MAEAGISQSKEKNLIYPLTGSCIQRLFPSDTNFRCSVLYTSWQKAIENENKLIRQHLPQGADLGKSQKNSLKTLNTKSTKAPNLSLSKKKFFKLMSQLLHLQIESSSQRNFIHIFVFTPKKNNFVSLNIQHLYP